MYRINLGNPTFDFMKIFDELFNESYCTTSDCCTSRKCPAHDVIESDDEFIVEMELAGIKKEDISIDIEDGTLTIETERKRDDTLKYNRKEMYGGKYKRSFNLPGNTSAEEIKAELSDGILTVTIPKTVDEAKKKKQIVIK